MAETGKDARPFLSRWSERKRAVRAEEEAEAATPTEPPAPSAEERAELEANRQAAEAIDLETLTDRSDYAPFFKPGVPPVLKHAALRKLWRSNPVFAVLDGLNDYDEDFTWPTSGSEVVKSAWKVGRGFLSGDDQAAGEERAAAKPAQESVAARETGEIEPAGEGDETQATPDSRDMSMPTPDAEPEPSEPDESPKVGLARRLDFAAFAKEGGKG